MSVELLLNLDDHSKRSLQKQIVDQIAFAIMNGNIAPDQPLPSSRHLSSQLGVGRNTVVLAYQTLLDDGYLVSRERSGYFVNAALLRGAKPEAIAPDMSEDSSTLDWSSRMVVQPTQMKKISKPANWQQFPYPFIYGQISANLFPVNHWRECSRDAVSVGAIRHWSAERLDHDDPLLIDQIRTRLLPRRGVMVERDNILITVGAQQGLALIAQLLFAREDVTVGLEDPGYVDVRNIVELSQASISALPVDDDGLIINESIKACDYLYVTPSHQSPTTVTMPLARRKALLQEARNGDMVIIEDDYEGEFNYASRPLPALKSLDTDGRVLYLGSMSKTLSPGLRLGYLVGSAEIIKQLRALRRLLLRHPAANNQHTLGLFLERGYHDSLIAKIYATYSERYSLMLEAVKRHLPGFKVAKSSGGSSFWLQGPTHFDSNRLAEVALDKGIIIEPGEVHFISLPAPKNCFRLGFSAVPSEDIEPGIILLAELISTL